MTSQIEWFELAGKPAFRGTVGKYRRLIVGDTREQLERWIASRSN